MQRDVPGSSGLVLAANVVHLDPAPAVFEAMLRGRDTQQRARYLTESTVRPRLRLMRRLVEFSNLYPWQWTPAEAEAFIAHLRSGPRPLALSMARGYGMSVRLFCAPMPDTYVISAWRRTTMRDAGVPTLHVVRPRPGRNMTRSWQRSRPLPPLTARWLSGCQ